MALTSSMEDYLEAVLIRFRVYSEHSHNHVFPLRIRFRVRCLFRFLFHFRFRFLSPCRFRFHFHCHFHFRPFHCPDLPHPRNPGNLFPKTAKRRIPCSAGNKNFPCGKTPGRAIWRAASPCRQQTGATATLMISRSRWCSLSRSAAEAKVKAIIVTPYYLADTPFYRWGAACCGSHVIDHDMGT